MIKKASKQFAEKVLTAGGEVIKDGIVNNIFEEDLALTGKLKDSIDVHALTGKYLATHFLDKGFFEKQREVKKVIEKKIKEKLGL